MYISIKICLSDKIIPFFFLDEEILPEVRDINYYWNYQSLMEDLPTFFYLFAWELYEYSILTMKNDYSISND